MATTYLDFDTPSSFSIFFDLLHGTGEDLPKFQAQNPPFFPLSSPRPFSPSSSSLLLNSSGVLAPSHIFPSNNLPIESFDWKSNSTVEEPLVKEEEKVTSDFSFRFSEITDYKDQTSEISKKEYPSGLNKAQTIHENKGSHLQDGYKWRKYGQKQVKGSMNPRSYYKCTFPNCNTKKLIETSVVDSCVVEVIYKGVHNHPKPQAKQHTSHEASDENSSVSFDENVKERFGEEDQASKRRKGEAEMIEEACDGFGNKAMREPRVVVETISDVDILDDGYKWRKYGQKVVRGNPNPRSYYKCTTIGCNVRKHVERAAHDLRTVITTYEGKHKHDVPTGRGVRPSPFAGMNGNHDNGMAMSTTIARPSPYAGQTSIQQACNGTPPFTSEMLDAPIGYRYSNGYEDVGSSYMQQEEEEVLSGMAVY